MHPPVDLGCLNQWDGEAEKAQEVLRQGGARDRDMIDIDSPGTVRCCYNCYNETSIYVYMRLRLIEEINHDRPVFSNVVNSTGSFVRLSLIFLHSFQNWSFSFH